jgi:hypothetical protein
MKSSDVSVPIPSCWTPEEAMSFLVFLDQLTSAIWSAYGDAIAPHLSRAQYLARLAVPAAIHDDSDIVQPTE